MRSALQHLDSKLSSTGTLDLPQIGSLKEFLLEHAKVKNSRGEYLPYSFKGREGLEEIVDTFDHVLGSHTGKPIPDAQIDICGGAQIGKTVFIQNAKVFFTACRWMNTGTYLPDDDLVQGWVDTKFRPDVIEQIDWLGPMMDLGTFEDSKGKRSVNRKGAFQVTDGKRKAFGMVRGMGKIPTTFSAEVIMEDEKDDIDPDKSKFLENRMAAGELRLRSSIGTQRVYGRGQNKQWRDGSQGVMMFATPDGEVNVEDMWPQVCRLQIGESPSADDPRLTYRGDFENDEGERFPYRPTGKFYRADPESGAVLDLTKPRWHHRMPERIDQGLHWSFRISPLAFEALDLARIVKQWCDPQKGALVDPERMIVFQCDILANPSNAKQALDEKVIQRSQALENYDIAKTPIKPGSQRFAGLDTGDRCWFVCREVDSESVKRIPWASKIDLADIYAETIRLVDDLDVSMLLIDARPHVQQARDICMTLNGLDNHEWVWVEKPDTAVIRMGSNITWDGEKQEWRGIRAAVVEFTRKPGAGTIHKLGKYEQAGKTIFYPIIQTSRYDLIDRPVGELLTPDENVIRVVDGELLRDPVMRLPLNGVNSPAGAKELINHLIVGSEKDEKDEYVDGCENHLLLANGYSALAEIIGGAARRYGPFAYQSIMPRRGGSALGRIGRRIGRAFIG